MAEAHDTLGAASAPTADAGDDADFFPLNDLPNDVLVSVFMAVGDLRWARHTVPCVCKAWNELYCSKDASPLHETLEVDFAKEVERAAAAAARGREGRRGPVAGAPSRRALVHASRVISWAERRAGSVRKLHLRGGFRGNFEDFSAKDLGALVAAAGSSLTDFLIQQGLGELCKSSFWESLRTNVVRAHRLRSFAVQDISAVVSESDVEPLGQLAGSLEELVLLTVYHEEVSGLPCFPESFLALEKLRRLVLYGHRQITAIPAEVSSLKKLEELVLGCCDLSSLPKELGELSGLTRLHLGWNRSLGNTLPQDEAFPAELGKLKSLRGLGLSVCGLRTVPAFVFELELLEFLALSHNDLSSVPKELGELSALTRLDLSGNEKLGTTAAAFPAELKKMKSLRELKLFDCGLRAVPAFIGELESLEVVNLVYNDYLQIDTPLDFLIEGCPRLRVLKVGKMPREAPFTPESLAHLQAFITKLHAKNPNAELHYYN